MKHRERSRTRGRTGVAFRLALAVLGTLLAGGSGIAWAQESADTGAESASPPSGAAEPAATYDAEPAAEDESAGEVDDPESATIGGPRFNAYLLSSAFYTDNFYYQQQQKEDASGAVIVPHVSYLNETSRWKLTLDASGEYGTFDTPGNADDYLDGALVGDLGWQAGVRNRFALDVDYRHGHDGFGTNRTEANPGTLPDDLDRYNQVEAGLKYRYGARGAKVNTELRVFGADKHYITNRTDTQVLDFGTTGIEYEVQYRIAPKTTAVADFSRSDIEFDSLIGPIDRRSGQRYKARAGVRWVATAKTSGDIRIGVRRRDFDSGDKEVKGLDWSVGVQWSPITNTVIVLRSARTEQQSYVNDVNARVIDNHLNTIDWKQTWTSRLNTSFELERSVSEHVGIGREDDIYRVGLGASYQLMSYLSVVGSGKYSQRDSNFAGREYDRIDALVGLRLDL